MSARIVINGPCGCGKSHRCEAWRTATPGLVVVDARKFCDQKPVTDEWWTITHLVTGLALPRVFASPESAMACAAALGGVWDWTRCEKPTGVVTEVVSLLVKFGGTYEPYGTHSGDIEVRNPEAVTQ